MNSANDPAGSSNRWYHQPIAWLGIAITVLLISACIWTVMISLRYTDHPQHGATPTVLGVPAPADSGSAEKP